MKLTVIDACLCEEIPADFQAQWTQTGYRARPSQADLATQRRPAGSILSPEEGDRRPLPTAMYEGQGTKRGRKSKIEIESKRVRKEERERESEGEEGECHYSTV